MVMTMTEISMQLREEYWRAEFDYWKRQHPTAKITYNKKKNEIRITYPLPKDFDIMQKYLKPL